MEDHELLALNQEGIFPGPQESREEFIHRAFSLRSPKTQEEGLLYHSEWASQQLHFLFDFRPRWVPIFLSSKNLAPWQAAAAWIGEDGQFEIQLRKPGWRDWLVCRDEIFAHEAVHAVRATFEESRYEEIFAYMTSSASWRRTLGAVFFKPRQTFALISLFFGAILSQIGMLFFSFFEILSLCGFILAGALIVKEVWALVKARLFLKRAAKCLRPLLRDARSVRAVLFRLTGEEIERFAKGEGKAYIEEQTELRWELLKKVYF